jgi:hypothetical protein
MRLMSTYGRLPTHICCRSSFLSLHTSRMCPTVCGP